MAYHPRPATSFCVAGHGGGGIRNPPYEPGWSNEPAPALTGSPTWHERNVLELGQSVKYALMGQRTLATPQAPGQLQYRWHQTCTPYGYVSLPPVLPRDPPWRGEAV